MIQGFIKIWEPETGNVLVEKKNAVHYENISIAMANALSNMQTNGEPYGFIERMSFGNGATTIDATGVITYQVPNTLSQNAGLYNQTYSKIINANNYLNPDPGRNFMQLAT